MFHYCMHSQISQCTVADLFLPRIPLIMYTDVSTRSGIGLLPEGRVAKWTNRTTGFPTMSLPGKVHSPCHMHAHAKHRSWNICSTGSSPKVPPWTESYMPERPPWSHAFVVKGSLHDWARELNIRTAYPQARKLCWHNLTFPQGDPKTILSSG